MLCNLIAMVSAPAATVTLLAMESLDGGLSPSLLPGFGICATMLVMLLLPLLLFRSRK